MNHLRLIRAPDYVYAHSNKGIALTCLGDLRAKLSRRDKASKSYAEAIAAFDVALHIAPDHVQIYNSRANVLKSLGELQAGLSQRDEASPLEGERMPTTHKKLYQVFLSHSSGDKAHIEKIAVRLVNEAGINPFLDKWHLVPGEPWQEALEEALGESETCAVFLGPAGLGPWENEEMRAALDERVKDKSLRVIPVLLPGANPKDNKTLPRFLRRLTWVDFRTGIDEEEPFHRLVAGIKGQSPGRGHSQPVRTYIPPVSASIVRSWFNNVINPVLSQLRRELPYLEKKEWSWQVSPRRLECIRQISFSLTHAEDTFNQLLSFYPDIKEMFRLYDQGVRDLYAACDDLQNEIKKSEDLKAVFETAKADIAKTPSGEPINGVFSVFSDEDHYLENLVHYIVVGAGKLPIHNSHQFVWSKYRDQFLALLERPGIRQKKQQMDEAGERLLMTVRKFIELLVETKPPLSLTFGEPV